MVIKMITRLDKRVDELNENFNKEIKIIIIIGIKNQNEKYPRGSNEIRG